MYTTTYRRALLAATLFPPGAICLAIGLMFLSVLTDVSGLDGTGADGSAVAFAAGMIGTTALEIGAILVGVGAMIAYVVDLCRRDGMRREERVAWAIAIVCGSLIGMLSYWWLLVRNRPSAARVPKV